MSLIDCSQWRIKCRHVSFTSPWDGLHVATIIGLLYIAWFARCRLFLVCENNNNRESQTSQLTLFKKNCLHEQQRVARARWLRTIKSNHESQRCATMTMTWNWTDVIRPMIENVLLILELHLSTNNWWKQGHPWARSLSTRLIRRVDQSRHDHLFFSFSPMQPRWCHRHGERFHRVTSDESLPLNSTDFWAFSRCPLDFLSSWN